MHVYHVNVYQYRLKTQYLPGGHLNILNIAVICHTLFLLCCTCTERCIECNKCIEHVLYVCIVVSTPQFCIIFCMARRACILMSTFPWFTISITSFSVNNHRPRLLLSYTGACHCGVLPDISLNTPVLTGMRMVLTL